MNLVHLGADGLPVLGLTCSLKKNGEGGVSAVSPKSAYELAKSCGGAKNKQLGAE